MNGQQHSKPRPLLAAVCSAEKNRWEFTTDPSQQSRVQVSLKAERLNMWTSGRGELILIQDSVDSVVIVLIFGLFKLFVFFVFYCFCFLLFFIVFVFYVFVFIVFVFYFESTGNQSSDSLISCWDSVDALWQEVVSCLVTHVYLMRVRYDWWHVIRLQISK